MSAEKITKLKERMFELETTIVHTFQQQKDRNREMFEISRELEQLENHESYEANKNHWEGHENRF